MKCVARTYFSWNVCCSNQQNPGAATFRDGSFDRWDVDQGFCEERKRRRACSLSRIAESQVVWEIHRRRANCPEWIQVPTVVWGPVAWARYRDERKEDFFAKNVSGPSNPPDELAQNVSKRNPRRTNYFSIFSSKVQNLTVFFNYLHDSNSIFRAGGINSELFFGRTVKQSVEAPF